MTARKPKTDNPALNRVMDDAVITLAMSETVVARREIRLRGRDITKLRARMKAQFKKVTGRDL